MNSFLRRFEILLPRQFNDGTPVPANLISSTLFELREEFGAVSLETQTIRGTWEHEGMLYRDDLVRVYVDVSDNEENQQFFRDFKEILKSRFGQLEIRVTTFLVEVY